MNLGWIGTTPVRRLPKQGRPGQHVALDGRVFTWSSKCGWVQVHPRYISETLLNEAAMAAPSARFYHRTR